MKTLDNHTLLYDKDCPMCEVYSGAFIKCGMLEKNGRENFSDMSRKNENIINYKRAKNEIALINQSNQKVFYGLDSLLVIIGNSFPALEKIGRFPPIYWFFKKFYSFISYNRKVIVPSGEKVTENSCVPSFNLQYRLFYIFFSLLFSTFVFEKYFSVIGAISDNYKIVLGIFTLGIIGEIIFLYSLLNINFYDYLGNVMTVSLIGSIILIPFLFLNLNPLSAFLFFIFVGIMMSIELHRRYLLLKKLN